MSGRYGPQISQMSTDFSSRLNDQGTLGCLRDGEGPHTHLSESVKSVANFLCGLVTV
jgi:hypothetical protein